MASRVAPLFTTATGKAEIADFGETAVIGTSRRQAADDAGAARHRRGSARARANSRAAATITGRSPRVAPRPV